MNNSDPAEVPSAELVKKALYPPLAQVKLGARQRLMQSEVQLIESYLVTVASGFRSAFERFQARVSKQAADMDEGTRNRCMEDWAESAHELTRHFPNFAWQTSFVAIYTLLEDHMLSITRTLGKHLRITLDPDDLQDKGIFAAKKYLKSLCAIAFPEGEHAWQEVLQYRLLRNVIVHFRGHVKGARREEAIRNYVRGNKYLSLDNLDRLQISQQFCFQVLENVEALLETLFKLARDKVCSTPRASQ
jgi:hypothetical protein